jgi:hypothetical protein
MLIGILNDLTRALLLKGERILSPSDISSSGFNEQRHINVLAHFYKSKKKGGEKG